MFVQDILSGKDNPVGRLVRAILELPKESRQAAVDKLVKHYDADTRALSLLVAERITHSDLEAICLHLLADPVWYVRMRACEFAERHHILSAMDRIISLLEKDDNEDVLATAALTVRFLGSKETLSKLETLTHTVTGSNHEGTPVREILLRSIEEISAGRVD